jgi:hypothetical protein
MPKRSSMDEAQLAKSIVDELTAEELPNEAPVREEIPSEKNPAAVALGRLGGLKGGKARAAKLSDARRKAIAKKAAKARWKSQKGNPSSSS